ncbi:IclR family transcriptional regulator [Glaciihabitans tibetensis]|uniref:Glycerol operon regulatory protein n=1 Tax=Glaciihabitans tibetensis TaxID=1266600 RepID=A0A2T0VGI7_9MICO|nr:IclR family transcriptional regulator [Glaciihabitans tibetensis]PRY69174.1 IclR family transcriptional regulator [Glaciihabitans tibetensis]
MGAVKVDMVSKALSLLVLLGDSAQGASATELAGQAELPFSTAHRLLQSLAGQGFVAFDPVSKRYTLGIRVFQLGQRVSNANGLTGSALPALRSLTAHTREASIMGILDGDHVLTVSKVDGPQAFRVTSDPGTHSPLHATALGKVLVAFSDRTDALVEDLELYARTEKTISDRSVFRREIARVREQGYGTMREENEVGMHALAAPVFSAGDQLVAAVAIAAPVFRLPFKDLLAHLPALKTAAAELSARLPAP